MASKEIPRDDLLILLSSMGVLLPDTKLPVDELNKKIDLAFDASQQLSTHLPNSPVDPSTFPIWDLIGTDIDSRPLYEATERRSISEICGLTEEPKQGCMSRKEDTFKEMRQTIMGIAYMFDIGQDEIFYIVETRKGILLKILEVRKLNEDVPLILFEYKELEPNIGDQCPAPTIPIIDLERRALLRLFNRNTKKLHENYYTEPKRDANGGLTHRSFVLPLCPLNMQTLGKLTNNAGCQVCGKMDNTSRCLQCRSVIYCSKECQKQDWPDHKSACKSLKGGTWSNIKLSNLPGKHHTIINRLDPLYAGSGNHSHSKGGSSIKPDEVHKQKIFLAKFQISLADVPSHMMIYDRQRSFQLLWFRSSNPTLFDTARQMMAGRYKFYRWVKRVGEDEMEVCLDRSLANDPVW